MNLLKELYVAPFRLIATVLQIFASNRKRMRDFVSRPKIAGILKFAMAITMLVWFAILLLTEDEEQNRLTEAVKTIWPEASVDANGADSEKSGGTTQH